MLLAKDKAFPILNDTKFPSAKKEKPWPCLVMLFNFFWNLFLSLSGNKLEEINQKYKLETHNYYHQTDQKHQLKHKDMIRCNALKYTEILK